MSLILDPTSPQGFRQYDPPKVYASGGGSSSSFTQTYTEFIFNSTGSQSGNRYNTWADLEDALQATEGYKRVTFENTSVVSPPFFNEAITLSGSYNDVVFRGNGTAAVSGGILVAVSGSVSSWQNMVIDSLGFIYVGSSAALMSVTTFTAKLINGAAFLAAGGQPIFSHSTGTLTLDASGGSVMLGASLGGGTIVAKGSGSGTVLLLAGSSNSNIESGIVTGTAGTVQVISTDASSADVSGVTMSGFSGTYSTDRLAVSANVKGPFPDKLRPYTDTSTANITLASFNGTRVSALAQNMTITITGTPTDGMEIILIVKDNGTSRNLTYPATFADMYATAPTATTVSKWHEVKWRYYSIDNKYYCISAQVQP